MKLNLKTDADILAWLDAQENKQGAIKQAIREEIKKQPWWLLFYCEITLFIYTRERDIISLKMLVKSCQALFISNKQVTKHTPKPF